MRTSAALLLALAITGVAGAHEPTLSRFNFREHVRPLFLRHCGGCHRPGGIAPMSLLDYQEAVPWANAIKLALLESRMPPFLPGDSGGPFRDARVLTAHEIDTLVDWAVGTTPEGEPLEGGENPSAPALPEPDLILGAPSDVVLEGDEREKTVCQVLPTGLRASRVLTALAVFPGQRSILRRGTILIGESCDAASPLATWLPDRDRISFPEGLGRSLPAAADLLLELHYVKGWGAEGKRILDRTSLGLWFSEGAEPVRSVRVEARGLVLDRAARLVSLVPADAEGSALRVEVVSPGGDKRLLLAIDRLDPAWREKYFFRTPILLPAGSSIRASDSGVWADLAETVPAANE